MAMTGVNVSALGPEYQEDTGGAGGGIPTLSPTPSVGFKPDPESQKLVDTYQAEYDSRPKMPHFSGFNAYWDLKQVVAAAEAASGLGDAKAWPAKTRKQDITPKKDGKMWLHYTFWDDGEAKEVTDQTYPHNTHFDLTTPYDDTQPSMVVTRQKEDNGVSVVCPPEYATTKFTVPNWVK